MDLLLIGNSGGTNVGDSLRAAAESLGLRFHFLDSYRAYSGSRLLKSIWWRWFGRRPLQLRRFSREALRYCHNHQVKYLVSTGVAPLSGSALCAITKTRTLIANFSTDDPWNKAHFAPWFLGGIPYYTVVFTPRKSTLSDWYAAGARDVRHLPFGYDPRHFRACDREVAESEFRYDVLFAGTGDADRIPYMNALKQSGLKLGLFGTYWDQFAETKGLSQGQANPTTLLDLIHHSRINLCLVRRANRDGHVMRTYEVPAAGGFMLAEDTEEHRSLFGSEGDRVLYFKSPKDAVTQSRWILRNPDARLKMARAACEWIVKSQNTYADRLTEIISRLESTIGK